MAHMVTVQSIEQGKSLVTIELDTGENIAIPLPVAAQYRLLKGKTLEKEEYRQLKTESERYLCKQKALDYLSVKNRTSHEIGKYLTKKGFSADIIAEVMQHLEETGIIDDLKYAVSYARSRRESKLVGKNLIARELHKKGLPRAKIRKAFEAGDFADADMGEVLALARKKLASYRGKKFALRKVGFFLTQRGFEYETIQRVMARLKNEEPEDEGAHDA